MRDDFTDTETEPDECQGEGDSDTQEKPVRKRRSKPPYRNPTLGRHIETIRKRTRKPDGSKISVEEICNALKISKPSYYYQIEKGISVKYGGGLYDVFAYIMDFVPDKRKRVEMWIEYHRIEEEGREIVNGQMIIEK